MNTNNKAIDYLYHYTSIDVLCKLFTNINKNNQLVFHASSLDSMNDSAEYKLARQQCKDYTEEFIVDNLKGIPFALCFSENEDNIPMWSMYANEGKGVCLRFNFGKLKEQFDHLNIKDKRESRFYFCKYQEFKTDEDEKKPLSSSNEYRDFDKIWKAIMQKSFIKPVCFSHEKEWRLLVWQSIFPTKKPIIKFKVRNDNLCPYIEIPISVNCIEEIILRPNADDQLIEATKLLLANYGGNGINVSQANITLKV